jgi:hypothetical protein
MGQDNLAKGANIKESKYRNGFSVYIMHKEKNLS